MTDARTTQTVIRRAQLGDAAEMVRLAIQLGYPIPLDEMTTRLATLLLNECHYIAVAVSGARILGRVHVEHRSGIEAGERAELMALVVDADSRRGGVGRELVEAAEHWALSRGLSSLVVRSNVTRSLSHPFYLALGYSRDKTQHVYSKTLKGAECRT